MLSINAIYLMMAGLDPLARDCQRLERCPILRKMPNQPPLPIIPRDGIDELRIANIDDDDDLFGESENLSSGCPQDSLLCCYPSQRDFQVNYV